MCWTASSASSGDPSMWRQKAEDRRAAWRSKTTSKAVSLPRGSPRRAVVAGKAQQAPGAQGTSGRGDVQAAQGITHMNAIGRPRFAHNSRTSVLVRRSRGMKTFSTAILGAPFSFYPRAPWRSPTRGQARGDQAVQDGAGQVEGYAEAFKAKYHSFSRCVRQNAAEEHAEKKAALQARRQGVQGRARRRRLRRHARRQDVPGVLRHRQARQERLRQVRVHQGARAEGQADDADDAEVQEFKNAAKQCAGERPDPDFASTHDGKSFEDFYGTNHNKRNAFGKCVSGRSQTYVDPIS